MNQESVKTSAEIFAEMMMEYENILRGTLTTMVEKGGEEADISLKLKIIMEEMTIPDGDEYRMAMIPRFEYKCTSNMKLQHKTSGMISNEDRELVWDEEEGWMLRSIGGKQLTFL